MNSYQTSLTSDTGQITVWPTKTVHPVPVSIGGTKRNLLVDVVMVDLPDGFHQDAEARFLLCGVHQAFDRPESRITGLEIPFLELPQSLRDEIVAELSKIAGKGK